ncbi:pyruvate decarboxylase [Aspergillus unguis]
MTGSTNGSSTVPIARYLWQRIRQLGVQSIMGVPGDMNLELLDYIDDVDGLRWVGNANELNAAYAADGYCRVKGCPGVLVTTVGVGELSAINGVAGAYTENVKLIHIVGTTAMSVQKERKMVHHCLGPNPDHRVYAKISEPVRTAHCWLDDPATAGGEIDRVIRECYLRSLPVYIFVPMDFVHVPISSAPLDRPVDVKPTSSNEAAQATVNIVIDKLKSSKAPSIIVDGLVSRFGLSGITNKLLDQLRIPTFTTPMGKSIVDETKPYFFGVYSGSISHPGIAHAVENESDLVIDIGPCHSDSNTGAHSRDLSQGDGYILVAPDYVQSAYARFEGVYMVDFISTLSAALSKDPPQSLSRTIKLPEAPTPSDYHCSDITQSWIWKRIGQMARNNDIVLGECGTAQFGFSDASFAPGVQYITQAYFGSIGYSVPSALGAAIAQIERGTGGRTILVVGDGSLQLTVQEIGTMVRLGLKNVIIMVINNNGYTIERAIHGPQQGYHDVATWNHQLLLSAFGDKRGLVNSRKVDTKAAFEHAVSDYTHLDSIQLLEVMMDKMDVPWRLKAQIELINERNGAALRQ